MDGWIVDRYVHIDNRDQGENNFIELQVWKLRCKSSWQVTVYVCFHCSVFSRKTSSNQIPAYNFFA